MIGDETSGSISLKNLHNRDNTMY